MRYSSIIILILSFLSTAPSAAQRKLDLDDIEVKGELHNDNRLKFYARQKNRLKNYVKFRQNYRDVIQQQVPQPLENWHQQEVKTEITAMAEPTLPVLPEPEAAPARDTASEPDR